MEYQDSDRHEEGEQEEETQTHGPNAAGGSSCRALNQENVKRSQTRGHGRWMLRAEAQRRRGGRKRCTVDPESSEAHESLCWQGALESLSLLFQATCCRLPLPAPDAWGAGRRNHFPQPQSGKGQLAALLARLPPQQPLPSIEPSPAVSFLSPQVLQK